MKNAIRKERPDCVVRAALLALGVTLSGGAAWADKSDDWFSTSDDSAVIRTFGTRHVCIFTNASASATLTLKKAMTLDEFLAVGGGGAGGRSISGGGGGGGVVHTNHSERIDANTEFTVTVGAGGICPTTPKGASGCIGGHSTVAWGEISITAYGGGGGGGFGNSPTATTDGHIGSGGGAASQKSIGTDGKTWNSAQGHAGFSATASNAGNDIGGGGGGAGTAADQDRGGEGLAFDLSGERVVYGSGGGAGARYTAAYSFGCRGGTNGGDGGAYGRSSGRPGVNGTGGGGGGGGHNSGTYQRGGSGGSGIVVLSFVESAPAVPRFAILPIDDQLLVGTAEEPLVVVTNGAGTVLTDGVDYTVSYLSNSSAGEGVAIAQGADGSAYEGFTAIRTFKIHPVRYEDANLYASDAGVSNFVSGWRTTYIFTNASDRIVIRPKKTLTREACLLVGGGGSGGGVYGGGGGGGGYVSRDDLSLLLATTNLEVNVGVGAAAAPAVGNRGARGRQGGHSWLKFGKDAIYAYGGGGGGGFNYDALNAAVYNEIGSGGGDGASGSAGWRWNASQGNAGGPTYGGNTRGGGGGALSAAVTKSGVGTLGGEGKTNAITGVAVVYGSGGGGCYPSGFSGAGGTNAGDGRVAGAKVHGGNGVNGTGGGGGGGGSDSYGSGGDGGSGIVVIKFSIGDHVNGRFTIAPVSDQLYFGLPIRPQFAVTNTAGAALAQGVDYTVSYSGSEDEGTATAILVGMAGTIYEGFEDSVSYTIRKPRYYDEFVYTDDDASVRRVERDGRYVYIFTNALKVTVHSIKTARLGKVLLVGGGGSGGNTIGSGGGGGGVVEQRIGRKFEQGSCLSIAVGAGGLPTTKSSTGIRYPYGLQGGHSTLSGDGFSVVAYGGGGGAGFGTSAIATSVASGEIGSAGGGGTQKGTNYNQGNAGGGRNDNYGGGGGGARTAGSGTKGGEGVTNRITGVAVVYGSGGGGGARNSSTARTAGAGGTNAGSGGDVTAGGKGADGTGSGGGGGGYDKNYTSYPGGRGGTGTVIFELRPIEGCIMTVR